MMEFKGVTLLITHYNRSSSLERLLLSFKEQQCIFPEIIVSDDCSEPVHMQKLEALQKQFHFRLIRAASNKGLGNNINKGQDAVKNPYTLYIQEDFVPKENFRKHFEDALSIIKERPDIDIIRFYAYFRYPCLSSYRCGYSEMVFRTFQNTYKKFYLYSDHPHLRRSIFLRKFGRYTEGVKGDVTEYQMMISFLKRQGKGLFYEDYQGLFEQINSAGEPSTMKRNFWRESNNIPIVLARHIYRHLKFNYDLFFNSKYFTGAQRLKLPQWIIPHLYSGKKFEDLTREDIEDLKERLSKYKPENPFISVVIPAWNEGDNIFRTLSSLASNQTTHQVEIIVINNNSTDHTQHVLDLLEVKNYLQPVQGTPHARQMGLYKARGKYHLCADADTFYPPKWIDLMTEPMLKNKNIIGVYGRYSLLPIQGRNKISLAVYEAVTAMIIRIRKIKREYLNVLGFSMGLVTETGRETGGFEVQQVRKFDNARGSSYFVDEAEDGRMALNLLKKGKLYLVTNPKARVLTSNRRLMAEGGILKAFLNRFLLHGSRIKEYFSGR